MPLYSEHISNMYYSGSPSYTSPSYGYKSSYNPLGTSYSASYLSPGGSYSKHSSLSSYSPHRAPISSRWIPRSYSPMLTPISERGTASPIRINSPRRIPISKRSYGTTSYIQRPININTESIDVSRDRYRHKPAESSASTSLPPPQRDDPAKDNENSPFMPRVDGKPETGIDSSPGIKQNTIKRGRTVVRLHTINRKEKDSPRKPVKTSQMQASEVNKQDAPETLVDEVVPGEPKESLSWREKLSEDLVYVDKKEKKSLGTKLVEKFIMKDMTEKESKKDKCDVGNSEGRSRMVPETLLPSFIVPSTSKSPDRRCSVEMLAEQACLLDSLIRGENLSTATLDLSKVGIADESKNKFDSSNSIKRRKTDDKGNPLKTTKSDHSLHDNLSKSLIGNKDSKILTKRRSLKKSHSGGSIYRLDSIKEFPKEPVHIDLPAIQENRSSPKEHKIEQKPKLRTKITTSVEISPPISPLKFRIENMTVEEKHHTPKKEISFSYDVDEAPIEDITLQGPKPSLRRTKERNSINKKSKKQIGTEPISPEPEDGNFWAKIGKRETVYLKKRKQNIEAAREENTRSFLWFPDDEESGVTEDSVTNNSVFIEEGNDFLNEVANSKLPVESESNNILSKVNEVNVGEIKDGSLKTVSTKLGKSKSSDNMQKLHSNTNNSSLKEKVLQHGDLVKESNKTSSKKLLHQDAEIKEDFAPLSEKKIEIEQTTNPNLSLTKPGAKKTTPTSHTSTNLETSKTDPSEMGKTVPSLPVKKTFSSDITTSSSTDSGDDVKPKFKENRAKEGSESKLDLNVSAENLTLVKIASENTTPTLQIRSKSAGGNLDKDAKPITKKSKTIESVKVNLDLNLPPETPSQGEKIPGIKELAVNAQAKCKGKTLEKDSKPISDKIETIESGTNVVDVNSSTKVPEKDTNPVVTTPTIQPQTKSDSKTLYKGSNSILKKIETIESAKGTVDLNLPPDTHTQAEITLATKLEAKSEGNSLERDSKSMLDKVETIESGNKVVYVNLSNNAPEKKTNPVVTEPTIQPQTKSDGKTLDKDSNSISEKSESSVSSNSDVDLSLSAKTPAEINIKLGTTEPTTQTSVKSECKDFDEDSKRTSEKIKSIDSDKANIDVNLFAETAKPSTIQVNTVLTLQMQAMSKVEGEKPELLVKNKQVEPVKDVKSNVSQLKIPKSTKKNMPTETTEANRKKKVNKAEIKVPEKNKNLKTDKINNDTICETCKKSLGSNSTKTSKLNVTSVNVPSTSKPSQDMVVQINAIDDKPTNNVQDMVLNSSVANLTDSNSKTESSASTSQIPIVIETKNIPNETLASDTEQIQTSVPSEEKTGEEHKAEKDAEGDGHPNKLKRSSIKEVAKCPKPQIKEEKAAKTLIATPRPLMKRAPQVIHSDSSDSSSEEDSSEEKDEDTSEESGEFYECDNNPDGRTSTGSNDSGFDSSAPTSPASFLQIKKDCDVNCHRKCEKLTANLCGVNQRLLVEALATRTASKKGGGDSPGPSSSNASSQLPVTDDVGDTELELEQSTAYGIFRKTGRFTPPARSIPRFRKYNIEDFQFIKVLGKGSFGKVLLAELRDTEYYYAVKCLKKDVVLEDDDVECTLIERKVLALGTNHPYLCHLFATFQTDSHLFFVMEYLNGGDLMFHIQQSGRFPEARARFYAAEIVSGLKFLHKRGIVYRDLKLDNILLDFDGHVRIADFGMCKLQIYLDKTADTFCGTPDYMAPEIIKGLKYNQTVDWWSFGVLLYEMLIGQSPFSGCDEDELFWSICNEMPSYPRFLSREALTILTRLLDKDAKTRLGGTECMHGDVREQEFFHPLHWDKLERRELETPFKPRVRHPLDTQYFDRAFTGERPRLTAVEPNVLRSMDQEPFRGFSYTNPNATDR